MHGDAARDWTTLFEELDGDGPSEFPAVGGLFGWWRRKSRASEAEILSAAEFASELRRRFGFQDPGERRWKHLWDRHGGTTLYFESGMRIQDASFHSQAIVDDARESRQGVPRIPIFILRFSNFGRMIAFNPLGDGPPEDVRVVVAEMAVDRGYVFRPTEALETPYRNGEFLRGCEWWWVRYFDYL